MSSKTDLVHLCFSPINTNISKTTKFLLSISNMGAYNRTKSSGARQTEKELHRQPLAANRSSKIGPMFECYCFKHRSIAPLRWLNSNICCIQTSEHVQTSERQSMNSYCRRIGTIIRSQATYNKCTSKHSIKDNQHFFKYFKC